MQSYVIRRLLYFIPTLILISIISFAVIQAPPGDFVTTLVVQMEARGDQVDEDLINALRARYGLGKPLWQQYLIWIGNILQGDLGVSMAYNQPVSRIIMDRLPWSLLFSFSAFLIVYAIGFPIGFLSAVRQYSIADYFLTFVGFIGLAIPNFMLALILLWGYFEATGQALVGIYSVEYAVAPWSFGKFLDLLNHLWIPAVIIGTAGTAGLIRIVRANLLDELKKLYVTAARAKGVPETRLILKYPVRLAINPVISNIGYVLPALISGEVITSIVIGLPTIGPVLLRALQTEDMFLAGSIVLILSVLTLVGTLVSDLLLAVIDPRIRHGV